MHCWVKSSRVDNGFSRSGATTTVTAIAEGGQTGRQHQFRMPYQRVVLGRRIQLYQQEAS